MSFIRDKLTVLVTIRNRRNTLPRVMNYYKDFPANVIFLDSTRGEKYDNCDLALPNKYEYVPGKNYVQKILDCLNSIDTKYSVVVCDDDFLSKEGVLDCVTFLEENDDYSACRGQEVALFDNLLSFETLDYLVDALDNFKSDSAKERVYNAWSYFNGANVHNIMRTEVQIKIQEFHLENPEFNAISVYDKTLSYITAVYGNIAVIPTYYIMRSNETGARSLKLEANADKDISDWKPEIKFEEHFLEADTTPLEDLVNSDREFIEKVFTNLCTERLKKKKFFELLDNNDLFVNTSIVIEGYPLLFRFGPGGNLMGSDGYAERFKERHEKSNTLYPILEDKNIQDVKHAIENVKRFPL